MADRSGEDEKTDRLARRKALGAELQKVFQDVSEEEAPERLRRLAEQLDERLRAAARIPPKKPPD